MNIHELYGEIIKLTPYEGGDDDFRRTLSSALKKYSDLMDCLDEADRPDNWDALKRKKAVVIAKINDIALNSYKGLPSTAYAQLSYMFGKQINQDLIWHNVGVNDNTSFYRMRNIADRRNGIEYKEMFHIPITMRRQVGTERYSIPGYPCLYLGNSIYVCWEEMNRPLMSNCWVSRLKNTKEIEVLDLRVPVEADFVHAFGKYIAIFPLIISCMIPTQGKSGDVFKPEYLIPQLIMEWIIKKNKMGVYYTSTHLTEQVKRDFEYPKDKYDNLAIPVKSPLSKEKNCKKLAVMFQITNPANYEIELLKHGQGFDGGNLDAPDPLEENYRLSIFGEMEGCLKSDEFELEELE